MTEKLRTELEKICLPEEARQRIVRNCRSIKEENNMTERKRISSPAKAIAAAAVLALAVCLTGVTAMAATGRLQGYFKDIKRWDGAITGEVYEQATDEIALSVIADGDTLTVEAQLLTPDTAPYACITHLSLGEYAITDQNGAVLALGDSSPAAEISGGRAVITLSPDALPAGTLRLEVSSFIGSAKAEQPLEIKGGWQCEFTK